jgi:hydroxyethylthiazole kinase-like uncharacterized protein yjeF
MISSFQSKYFINQPLEGRELMEEHLPIIISLVNEMKPTGIAIGPGLWRTEKTRGAVIKIFETFNLPFVIDADAIRAMSAVKEILKNKTTVLTPHANEFKEFTGIEVSNNIDERVEAVKDAAKKWRTVILLKGHVDVISDGERVKLNFTGNPGMTVGGTGDVLSGVVAAFLAQGAHAFEAAVAGAFVNGACGDFAQREKGFHMVATDLIDWIPRVIDNPMSHLQVHRRG